MYVARRGGLHKSRLCDGFVPASPLVAGRLQILTLEGPPMSMAAQILTGWSLPAHTDADAPRGLLSRSVTALARAAAPAALALASIAGSVSAQVGLVDFGPIDPVS